MEMPNNNGVETKEVKVKKEKVTPVTNVLVGVTEAHLAMFKEGRSKRIAELLAQGYSKSEIVKMIAAEEAENPVEGRKEITHQVVYQVYKRLKGLEGVTIGSKDLIITRKVKEKVEGEEASEKTEKTDVNADFADAAEGVEGTEVTPENGEEVIEG